MNAKVLAVATSLVLMSVGFLVALDTEDSSATNSGLAEYKIYIGSVDQSNWAYECTGIGYNAYIALKNALNNSVTGDDNYTMDVESPWGDYTTINPNYGTIYSVNNITPNQNYVWNVYMYDAAEGEWVVAPVQALGFFQAYDDYDVSLRTANLVLFYGAEGYDFDDIFNVKHFTQPSSLKNEVHVTNTDEYKVTFYFSMDPNMTQPDWMSNAQWQTLISMDNTHVTGYGSNCYLALKNAISGVSGNDEMYDLDDYIINNSSYGYASAINGVSENSVTSQGVTTWWYWSLYTGSVSPANYSGFTAGFYTPLSGLSGFQYSTLYFDYEVS